MSFRELFFFNLFYELVGSLPAFAELCFFCLFFFQKKLGMTIYDIM